MKMNGIELDSHGLLPIWPQLYCLLRSGCSEMELDVFADDRFMSRFGGAVGNDILMMLRVYVG